MTHDTAITTCGVLLAWGSNTHKQIGKVVAPSLAPVAAAGVAGDEGEGEGVGDLHPVWDPPLATAGAGAGYGHELLLQISSRIGLFWYMIGLFCV